jgi:hypothetical protein
MLGASICLPGHFNSVQGVQLARLGFPTSLEDNHVCAPLGELGRHHQAGEASANNSDVSLDRCRGRHCPKVKDHDSASRILAPNWPSGFRKIQSVLSTHELTCRVCLVTRSAFLAVQGWSGSVKKSLRVPRHPDLGVLPSVRHPEVSSLDMAQRGFNPKTVFPTPAFGCLLLFFAVVYGVFISGGMFVHDEKIVGTLFDDALISLRYGRNLAEGHGLVWNAGETPPVEGYTNPLWTLLMAGVALVSSVEVAPIVVSGICAILLLVLGWLAYWCARRCGSSQLVSWLAGCLALSYFPLVFWALRGMEVALIALLLLWAVYEILSDEPDSPRSLTKLWTLAAVSFLVRMDSLVAFAPLLFLVTLNAPNKRAIFITAWPLVLAVAAQTAFRFIYYQELVPNTYVLKMTGVPDLERVTHGIGAFLNAAPGPLLCLGVLILGLFDRQRPDKPRQLALVAVGVAIAEIGYLIWVGGDAWRVDNSNRFLSAIFPLLLVAVAVNLPATLGWIRRRIEARWLFVLATLGGGTIAVLAPSLWSGLQWNVVMLVGAVVGLVGMAIWRLGDSETTRRSVTSTIFTSLAIMLVCSGPAWIRWGLFGGFEVRTDIAFARQGLWLSNVLPKDATIAASWLGAPSYYSGLTAFDAYGKVDKIIARTEPTFDFRPGHNKINLDHTIGKLQPDLVLLTPYDLTQYGYLRLPNATWVRPAFLAKTANVDDLGRSWCVSPEESTYCPK